MKLCKSDSVTECFHNSKTNAVDYLDQAGKSGENMCFEH